MEQPFHPSEVSLLVLRYLAAIGCKDAARCFFKEYPSLREFLESKNRGCETPRGFEAPQVLGSLAEILYDYGRAKIIVKNLVVKLLSDWRALSEDSISPCDTLATQLRQIGLLLGQTFSNEIRFSSSSRGSSAVLLPPPKSTRDMDTQTVTVIPTKRMASTCTTLDIPESQNIVVMAVKRMCHGGTQTDIVDGKEPESQATQVDNENDTDVIPLMFYQNMLNNPELHKMIASNINLVASGTRNEEELVKTVSNKTENEIDNFLSELLQGEENSQGGFSYSWNIEPMDMEVNEQPNLVTCIQGESGSEHGKATSSNNSQLNTPAKVSPKELPIEELQRPAVTIADELRPKATPQFKSPKTTPNRNITQPSLKTTAPTITLSPSSLSAWQRLGRRNIAPKIPVPTSSVRVSAAAEVPVEATPLPKVATPPITAQVQQATVLETKTNSQLKEAVPTPTTATHGIDETKISEPGKSQPKTKLESGHFKDQVKRNEKMSPLMQRLMASAQKYRHTTTMDLERKSFSTPRKKKHVRNLLFTTPPNLTKGSKASSAKNNLTQIDVNEVDLTKSAPVTRKRKAESIAEPKSRKRLDMGHEAPKCTNEVREEPQGSRKSTRQRVAKNTAYSATIESVIQTSQTHRQEANLVPQRAAAGKAKQLENKPAKTPPEKAPAFPKKSGSKVPKGGGTSTASNQFIGKSITPPSPPKQASKKKSRRSEEESALKAVADKAVPLGRPNPVSPLKKRSPVARSLNNKEKESSVVQSKRSPNLHAKSILQNGNSSLSSSFATPAGPLPVLSKGALKEVGSVRRKSKSPVSSGLTYSIIPQLSTSFANFACHQASEATLQTQPLVPVEGRGRISHGNSNEMKSSQPAPQVLPPLPSVPNLLPSIANQPPQQLNPPFLQSPLPPNSQFQPPLPRDPPFQPPLPRDPPFQPPLPQTSEFLSPYPKPSQNKPLSRKPSPNQPQFDRPDASVVSGNSRSAPTSLVRPKVPQTTFSTSSRSHSQQRRPCAPPPLPPSRPSDPPPPPPAPPAAENRCAPIQRKPSTKSPADQSTVPVFPLIRSNIVPAMTPVKNIAETIPDEPFEPVVPSPARFLMNFGGSSWDSVDAQITLNYENNGVYPGNLLLSTPLKTGIPRTPGRFTPSSDEKSRSSCSSIFDTPDVGAYKEQNCPGLGDLNTPVPKATFCVPPQPTPTPTPMSPGEVTTSSSSKSNQQENCAVSSTSQDIKTYENVPSSSQVDVPKSSNFRQHEVVQFEVSGRTKQLTLSEQQTLFSLLEMQKGPTLRAGSPNTKTSGDPAISTVRVVKDDMMKLLKKVDLDHFLTRVHGVRK